MNNWNAIYKENKTKWIELSALIQSGGAKKQYKHILLDGVRSLEKSSIAKLLGTMTKNKFIVIQFDDYDTEWINMRGEMENIVEKKLDLNQYMDQKMKINLLNEEIRKWMYDDAIRSKNNIIYDDSGRDILKLYSDKNKVIIVYIYESLNWLLRNISKRQNRLFTESKNVFKMYADRCTVSNADENSIDVVKLSDFVDDLKKYLKYEFDSEDSLIRFAKMIFKTMGINDDKSHNIKLRDKYDYLIKSDDKKIKSVAKELSQIIIKNDK